MTITVSPHHYFAIFLFIIYAGASIVTINATYCQDLRGTNPYPVDFKCTPNPYPVDFKCTLNVEELTEKTYGDFITELRTKLAKGGSISGDVPILPNYGDSPHLFDVLLTTEDHRTNMRVRRDNLYIRGYLIYTLNKWMEFKDEKERHMVNPKSEFLPFGDSYKALEDTAGTKVTSIGYTKYGLFNAVASLSKPISKDKGKSGKDQAKALIFMAQMISEAARFVDISTFFGSQLEEGEHLPQWMRDLENDWGKFSKVVQCSDKYNNKYKYKEVTINRKVYKTVDQLRTIFGVMLKETELNDKTTCGVKKIANEEEGEGVVELSVDIQ